MRFLSSLMALRPCFESRGLSPSCGQLDDDDEAVALEAEVRDGVVGVLPLLIVNEESNLVLSSSTRDSEKGVGHSAT